uniref:Uncharacterized protein n=1 Tax=Meloidogyne incognita TaxID=6306 RepID=A0A914MRG8_MELIC
MNNKRDSSLFEEPPRSNKKVRLEACDDILSQVLNNNSIQIEENENEDNQQSENASENASENHQDHLQQQKQQQRKQPKPPNFQPLQNNRRRMSSGAQQRRGGGGINMRDPLGLESVQPEQPEKWGE